MTLEATPDLHQREITLKPVAPFDFTHTLARFQGLNVSAAEIDDQGGFRQTIRILNEAVHFSVRFMGEVNVPRLALTLTSAAPITQELEHACQERLRFYLSLDDDLTPFYERAKDDPAFWALVETLYGFHQVKFTTPFEAACWAIITQRTPNTFAKKSLRKLAQGCGSQIVLKGTRYHAFPDAGQLLEAGTSVILDATNNMRKAERLIALAEAFVTVDEAFLRDAPRREVSRWLKKIKGVGAWSVDFILLHGLGRMEQAPWQDMWLLDAVSAVYTKGLTIHQGDAKLIAQRYAPYAGYWAHYLKIGKSS